jgi:FixJ family two-component response regulator|uniref:response regulator transcription factor n=1 Tax=uncultured Sphingomonas sp. TaxID=158754 RepID=UPI0035CB42A7
MTGTITPERPKILLVEDDSGVRRSLQLLLRGRGYDVRAYAGGAQMLDDPRSREAACLITDYRMAALDGLAILQTLRALGWTRPAVLITAFGGGDLAVAARAAGFDMVLEKPLQDHLLIEAVGRMTRTA